MYMLLKEKKEMYNFLYYAIFMCTITVVIWQDYHIGFDRYEFYQLVFSHHFLLICSMYALFVWEYPVNKKGFVQMLKYSILVYILVFIFNYFTGSNYIFSNSLPDFILEAYPFIANIHPLICLLVVAIPLLLLAYIPVYLKNKPNNHLHV